MFDQGKMIGFKFVVTSNFPISPPIAFLDEPINESIYFYIDYLKPGNILDFAMLHEWKLHYNMSP